MKTIHKYPIEIASSFAIKSLPEYAPIIRVGLDPVGVPCIWAEVFSEWVDAIAKYETEKSGRKIRHFGVTGTGRECPNGEHVGSWVQDQFVWHLYETTKQA